MFYNTPRREKALFSGDSDHDLLQNFWQLQRQNDERTPGTLRPSALRIEQPLKFGFRTDTALPPPALARSRSGQSHN